MSGRSLLADASTPAYRTVWNLGGGTAAQRRVSSESGSRSTAKVPSLHDQHRPTLTYDSVLLGEAAPLERGRGIGELPHHRSEQQPIEAEPTSPCERDGSELCNA